MTVDPTAISNLQGNATTGLLRDAGAPLTSAFLSHGESHVLRMLLGWVSGGHTLNLIF